MLDSGCQMFAQGLSMQESTLDTTVGWTSFFRRLLGVTGGATLALWCMFYTCRKAGVPMPAPGVAHYCYPPAAHTACLTAPARVDDVADQGQPAV